MRHYVTRNYCPLEELPSWEEVYKSIQLDMSNNRLVKKLDNGGYITHHGENIPKVEALRKTIHAQRPEHKYCSAHIYTSMSSSSKTFGRHKDTTDVYFIQAVGRTKWIIEEEDKKFTYILMPGDMIFLPIGLYHTPMPLGRRVGISIGFK
jgi:ribosomal protein L16 Arg81 hydroxylase